MATPEYAAARDELARVAERERTAVMCAEAVWWQCHRGLIADDFKAHGWEVIHLTAPGRELLMQSGRLDVHVGGAEANVAIGLACLDHPTAMVSAVPDNPLGRGAVAALRAQGVDTSGVQMRDGLPSVPSELRSLGIRWRDPALLSKAQNTDATMKQVEAGVLPAESDVTLEQLGYDDTTIQRIQADRRRLSGAQLAQALIEATAGDVAG